jgi:hypothetical protein
MKKITKSILFIGVATLTATTLYAKSSNKQATEVVHFSTKVAFTNDGVEPSASGTAQATQATQGNADHESLSVTLKGLTPSTTYSLTAITTSNSTPTDLNDFTTDSKGGAKLTFQNNAKGKNLAFPDGVLPLTGLSELDVVNSSSQAVLTASRDEVSSVKYMVKKPMDDTAGNGESGTVTLTASSKSAKFGLTAAGLSPSTDYVVVIDGTAVSTNTSTSKGALKVSASPSPSEVLNASNISLQDTSGNTILSTVVP